MSPYDIIGRNVGCSFILIFTFLEGARIHLMSQSTSPSIRSDNGRIAMICHMPSQTGVFP